MMSFRVKSKINLCDGLRENEMKEKIADRFVCCRMDIKLPPMARKEHFNDNLLFLSATNDPTFDLVQRISSRCDDSQRSA